VDLDGRVLKNHFVGIPLNCATVTPEPMGKCVGKYSSLITVGGKMICMLNPSGETIQTCTDNRPMFPIWKLRYFEL
jgi:hypothetical protein